MTDSIFFLLMRIMAILGFVFVIAAGILYVYVAKKDKENSNVAYVFFLFVALVVMLTMGSMLVGLNQICNYKESGSDLLCKFKIKKAEISYLDKKESDAAILHIHDYSDSSIKVGRVPRPYGLRTAWAWILHFFLSIAPFLFICNNFATNFWRVPLCQFSRYAIICT